MYQITMTINGHTINGAVYATIEETADALYELRTAARENNFPATYKFNVL